MLQSMILTFRSKGQLHGASCELNVGP